MPFHRHRVTKPRTAVRRAPFALTVEVGGPPATGRTAKPGGKYKERHEHLRGRTYAAGPIGACAQALNERDREHTSGP